MKELYQENPERYAEEIVPYLNKDMLLYQKGVRYVEELSYLAPNIGLHLTYYDGNPRKLAKLTGLRSLSWLYTLSSSSKLQVDWRYLEELDLVPENSHIFPNFLADTTLPSLKKLSMGYTHLDSWSKRFLIRVLPQLERFSWHPDNAMLSIRCLYELLKKIPRVLLYSITPLTLGTWEGEELWLREYYNANLRGIVVSPQPYIKKLYLRISTWDLLLQISALCPQLKSLTLRYYRGREELIDFGSHLECLTLTHPLRLHRAQAPLKRLRVEKGLLDTYSRYKVQVGVLEVPCAYERETLRSVEPQEIVYI